MQRAPGDSVLLLGLDIGSTTSAVLIAKARLERGSQGTVLRCRADDVVYRPAPDFTPMTHDGLDEQALGALLDRWLSESGIVVDEVFAGGALVTGLAAQAGNIDRVERLVTFSGGIGELIYAHTQGEPWPETTCFGDLGVDLARAIVDSPVLSANIDTHIPEQQGRATVTGLALNSSEISGASLYLPDASRLPLRNLPVIGQLHAAMPDAALAALLALARGCQSGVCYQLAFGDNDNPGADVIRAFGLRLAAAIQGAGLDPALPLVFLLQVNAGKALGNYISDWGQTAQRLLVIDEVPVRDARFVNIGRSRSGVVPVTFYGLNNDSENHEVRYG